MAAMRTLTHRLRAVESRLSKRPDPNARPVMEVLYERMQEIAKRVSAPDYVPPPEPTPEERAAEMATLSPTKRELIARLNKLARRIASEAERSAAGEGDHSWRQ
jgi:hypothetical protein